MELSPITSSILAWLSQGVRLNNESRVQMVCTRLGPRMNKTWSWSTEKPLSTSALPISASHYPAQALLWWTSIVHSMPPHEPRTPISHSRAMIGEFPNRASALPSPESSAVDSQLSSISSDLVVRRKHQRSTVQLQCYLIKTPKPTNRDPSDLNRQPSSNKVLIEVVVWRIIAILVRICWIQNERFCLCLTFLIFFLEHC